MWTFLQRNLFLYRVFTHKNLHIRITAPLPKNEHRRHIACRVYNQSHCLPLMLIRKVDLQYY